jgi:hypothetical protein
VALTLPPVPIGEPEGSFAWQQWYLALQQIYNGTGTIAWALVDKTGSNITDIATRAHNNLQSAQGGTSGERYHLTQAEHTSLTTLATAAAGTWTPTLTNVTNLDASTAYEGQYVRFGSTVTCSGKVDVDPTAAAATELGISLPIASNFAATEQCAGVGQTPAVAQESVAILADATNNRASMQWIATDTANRSVYFTFTYQVI